MLVKLVQQFAPTVKTTLDRRPSPHLCQLPTLTLSVGVGRIFESVCLSVCPQHNSKMNDPKVFKLVVGNDLGIP